MRVLDDLRDKLVDQFKTLWNQIEESSTYNTLKEKFEELPAQTQKITLWGGLGIAVLGLASCPLSYYSTSSDKIAEFEEYRELTRGLLKASNLMRQSIALPPGLSTEDLSQRVNALIERLQLTPEQIVPHVPLGQEPAGSLAPKQVLQNGLAISLKKLNLEQAISIGQNLMNLDPSIKMIAFDIQTSPGETHYYDTSYQLVSFQAPMGVEGSDD